jgi:hypothetical protein
MTHERELKLEGTELQTLVDGFFGFGAATTKQALDVLRGLAKGKPPVYWHPKKPPWTSPEVPGIRIYALGPPHDEKDLKRTSAKKEVYEAAAEEASAACFFASMKRKPATPASDELDEDDDAALYTPFDPRVGARLDRALKLAETSAPHEEEALVSFLREHYVGPAAEGAFPDQTRRRIDAEWLSQANEFALKLDNATNNTSLVLAVEIVKTGAVLLFAADAQAGNWLSWEKLDWELEDGTVITAPDLLRRTVFYKVGHHGSHNATMKQKGLELMESEELVAFIPVDKKMARAKRWSRMPLPALVERLEERAAGRVLQSDEDVPKPLAGRVEATELYFEYRI